MPFGKINSLRASYYFYGSLLGRYGQATVGLPGGCDLGPRPIDLHLKAFEAMGASISYEAESMRIATDAGQCIILIFIPAKPFGCNRNLLTAFTLI